MIVCCLDNRGVGRSSSPAGRQSYRTHFMAEDALHLAVSLAPDWLLAVCDPEPLLAVARLSPGIEP